MSKPLNSTYVKISSSGQYQTVTTGKNTGTGLIYRSTDYGATWNATNAPSPSGSNYWAALSMSSSGQYQTAAISGGFIYRSVDYGATWSQVAISAFWNALSMSKLDGQYQTAVITGGFIYRSIDYGATWSQVAISNNWNSISMSSSGQYQTAVISLGFIYRSIDYGATWSQVAISADWNSISMSSSGQYQTAVIFGGFIYRSVDYGATWSQVAISANWNSLIMSSNGGQYQTAVIYGGFIYRSVDYGATWSQVAISANWLTLTMSSEGQYQTAIISGLSGFIYISQDYGATWNILSGYPNAPWATLGMSSDGQYQTVGGTVTTYSWPDMTIVCFLGTCNLKFSDGTYKNIKNIVAGDTLCSAIDGGDIRVLHCGYNVVSDLSQVESTNHPIHIPAGFFGVNSPSRDVFISGHHRLFFDINGNKVGIQAFKLLPYTLDMEKALKMVNDTILKYFHIEVEGGKNAVFCDGLPVETLDKGEWDNIGYIENKNL